VTAPGKQSGLGDRLFISGYDFSGDIGSLGSIGGGPAALVVTGIDKSAFERIGGLRDGRMEFSAFFNTDPGRAHEQLSALPTADIITTYCRGIALGAAAASVVAKQVAYDGTRAADGQLTFGVPTVANGFALEWGEQLTAGPRTDTGATSGTGVDFAAATEFGLQAYLHVMDFDGTDVTIKLQQSSDNGGADAWADVADGAFASVTAGPQAQRIQTARDLDVERYLRVVTTTVGGFTTLTFAVMVVKNATEVTF
jgi:hypothetical protein